MTLVQTASTWLILFCVAFTNGAFRELGYRQFLGESRANQVSCGVGILLIGVAVWALSRFWRFVSAGLAWRTGLIWFSLTVAWEFLFGHYVMGHPWERLLHDYAIWDGRLWVLVLAFILCAPALTHVLDRFLLKRKKAV